MTMGVERETLWRLFLTSTALQALAMGLLALLPAAALWTAAPATITALD